MAAIDTEGYALTKPARMSVQMTVEELVEAAKKQRGERRYHEALALANAAVEQASDSAEAWWQLALTKYALDDLGGASSAFQKTVNLAPSFAYGWVCYGRTLWRLKLDAEAEGALECALELDADEDEALELLADLYGEKKDEENQFKVLNHLAMTKGVPRRFFNQLGILHYNRKNYLDAIDYYKRDAATGDGPAPLFNLGLVYRSLEISQEADAVDIWRLTEKLYPDFDRSTTELTKILPRVLELAAKARVRPPLLGSDQHFLHYLNPYELLGVPRQTPLNELTPKVLQRFKRTLLQEIELEEGRVGWLEDSHIDRSKAIAVCDQVFDKRLGEFHWHVYQCLPLLRFLTRGDHSHFLVDGTQSPLEMLQRIDDQSTGFLQWLSEPFSRQFDLLLAEAIRQQDLLMLECILDGRRWVTAEDRDKCFEGGRRRVDQLLQALRQAADSATKSKPPLTNLVELVRGKHPLIDLLNLLPVYFRDFQNEACRLLRSIAIDCNNVHQDAEMAKDVLGIAKTLRGKSSELSQKLADDLKQIDDLIAEEIKHEARLTRGALRWEITKDGARIGDIIVPPDSVTAVRWGILISGERSTPRYEYLLVVSSRHKAPLEYSWQSSTELEKNDGHFSKLVGATLHYLFPSVVARLKLDFEAGHSVQIGQCVADRDGVKITTKGWFSSKIHLVPWSRLNVRAEAGMIIASDMRDRNVSVSMPQRTTDNVAVLQVLAGTSQ